MLLRQQVKTVTHVVELPNFVQDRIRMHGEFSVSLRKVSYVGAIQKQLPCVTQ
jgi:hypothetical protein